MPPTVFAPHPYPKTHWVIQHASSVLQSLYGKELEVRTRFVSLSLIILLLRTPVSGQWVETNGPDRESVTCIVVIGTNLFAATYGWGIFLSTNNGASWSAVNSGLTAMNVTSLQPKGTNLFAGTYYGGVFVSSTNGTSWTPVNNGLADQTPQRQVRCLDTIGSNLFAGTWGGVFVSTDSGKSWTAANAGLPSSGVGCFGVAGTNLFGGRQGGVFLSTNNGTEWSAVNNAAFSQTLVTALAIEGTNLFAGTDSAGIFLSTNNGNSWTAVSAGLTNTRVYDLAVSGTTVFAATLGGGVHSTVDSGTSWSAVNAGLTNLQVRSLAVSGTHLFAGTAQSPHMVWRRPLSEMLTSVRQGMATLPKKFLLHQNYPNPFNPSTTITVELPKSSEVRLCVLDMLGREVSVLVNERRDAGVHEIRFDAVGLSSGVYLYRLQAGDVVYSKKLIVLK